MNKFYKIAYFVNVFIVLFIINTFATNIITSEEDNFGPGFFIDYNILSENVVKNKDEYLVDMELYNTIIKNNVLQNNIDTLNTNISTISNISTNSTIKLEDIEIFEHDGIKYIKGENKGKFSLSGYCACTKCTYGTGITYSGKPVRENHTIAADRKVLPIGTVIILENAIGKDGSIYDGVYHVEDIGGGVKNNHLDIYRPTHDLASLVTHYGRCYGEVYIAVPISTQSEIPK